MIFLKCWIALNILFMLVALAANMLADYRQPWIDRMFFFGMFNILVALAGALVVAMFLIV